MRALVSSSVIVSGLYLGLIVSHHANGSPLSVVLKVASIGLLIALAATTHPVRKLLVVALVSSAGGDLLLEVRHIGSFGPTRLFLAGLISFLVAHLFYVAMFLKGRSLATISTARKIACVIVIIVVATSLSILWPGLAEMRIPVVAYSMVLAVMVITAQLSRFSKLVAIGALLFLASDTMLAMSIFGHPFA